MEVPIVEIDTKAIKQLELIKQQQKFEKLDIQATEIPVEEIKGQLKLASVIKEKADKLDVEKKEKKKQSEEEDEETPLTLTERFQGLFNLPSLSAKQQHEK